MNSTILILLIFNFNNILFSKKFFVFLSSVLFGCVFCLSLLVFIVIINSFLLNNKMFTEIRSVRPRRSIISIHL